MSIKDLRLRLNQGTVYTEQLCIAGRVVVVQERPEHVYKRLFTYREEALWITS